MVLYIERLQGPALKFSRRSAVKLTCPRGEFCVPICGTTFSLIELCRELR